MERENYSGKKLVRNDDRVIKLTDGNVEMVK